MESLASGTQPCLGCLDVLVQRILYVVTLHPQLASCWVMALNPRDEAVRLVRLGAPLDLELVDR